MGVLSRSAVGEGLGVRLGVRLGRSLRVVAVGSAVSVGREPVASGEGLGRSCVWVAVGSAVGDGVNAVGSITAVPTG